MCECFLKKKVGSLLEIKFLSWCKVFDPIWLTPVTLWLVETKEHKQLSLKISNETAGCQASDSIFLAVCFAYDDWLSCRGNGGDGLAFWLAHFLNYVESTAQIRGNTFWRRLTECQILIACAPVWLPFTLTGQVHHMEIKGLELITWNPPRKTNSERD